MSSTTSHVKHNPGDPWCQHEVDGLHHTGQPSVGLQQARTETAESTSATINCTCITIKWMWNQERQ